MKRISWSIWCVERELARFGFHVLYNRVILDTSVRTGGDYGVTVSATTSQTAGVLSTRVTFWGVPAIRVTTSCADRA